jgi:hypothetical protein
MNVKKSLIDFVTSNKQQILGWTAVGLSTAITCLWSVWGIVENFHEGWYYESLLSNLGLMFTQYLSIPIVVMALSLIALQWPRIGKGLFIAVGIFALYFFAAANPITVRLLIASPIVALGLLYLFGRPKPKKVAQLLLIGLPLLIIIILGTPNYIRVVTRVSDGDFGTRLVEGNGVALIWAPRGPGWPDEGVSWTDATQACKYLSEDGTTILEEPQNIWRLPTIDEAVRSQARHGENSGGVWDPLTRKATYEITPDKETPLWDMHSPVIYLWTSEEKDDSRAYMFVYNGQISHRKKTTGPRYHSFRCVKLDFGRTGYIAGNMPLSRVGRDPYPTERML